MEYNIKFKVLAVKFNKHANLGNFTKAMMYASPIIQMDKLGKLSKDESDYFLRNIKSKLKLWKGTFLDNKYYLKDNIKKDADHVMSSSMWKNLNVTTKVSFMCSFDILLNDTINF